MSYYLKINDTVHSNTQNPFKAAYQVQISSWGEYNYNTSSTTFPPYYEFSSTDGTPLIALKDGSKPIYDYIQILDNIDYGTPVGHTDPKSYVCMCMASFSSSNEQYCLAANPAQVTAFYRTQSNPLVSIKEIYGGNKPVIRYVDLDKGNMLSWSIYNPDPDNTKPNPNIDFMSAYVYYMDGPYPSVPLKLLRNNGYWGNTSDTASYNDFPSNISNYQNVRFEPQKTNTKFGYTEHLLNMNDTSGRGTLSYYTLNVSDITAKGNKLKLNYYYTILFDGNYIQNSDIENCYELISPLNLSADWNKYFSNVSSHRQPFLFNYHLNDTTTWNLNETNELLQTGVNLTSAWRY